MSLWNRLGVMHSLVAFIVASGCGHLIRPEVVSEVSNSSSDLIGGAESHVTNDDHYLRKAWEGKKWAIEELSARYLACNRVDEAYTWSITAALISQVVGMPLPITEDGRLEYQLCRERIITETPDVWELTKRLNELDKEAFRRYQIIRARMAE